MAEYVKRLLNGYFFGSHGYSRKIGSHGYSRKIGSSQELAELAKTFSRDFREEELEKLGDEAEANQLKFTEEMRTRLQDKVQDSWSQDLHCRPFIEQVMAVPAGYPIIQTTAPPQFQLTPQGLIQTQPQQQFGYLTPQGIIVNQPAQAPAPGFFPTAASPFAPGTTATATASGQIIYSPQPPPAAYLPAATPGYPAMSHLMTQTSIPTPIPPPHTPLPAPPPPTSSAPHITPSQQKKIARVQPQPSKVVRPLAKLDANGCVPLTEEDFVNEQDSNVENAAATDDKVYRIGKADPESEEHILYEVTADDGGFHAVSADASELWRQVFEAVQAARSGHGMRPLPLNPLGEMGMQMIGLAHSALSFLLRQMPAARASTDAGSPRSRRGRARRATRTARTKLPSRRLKCSRRISPAPCGRSPSGRGRRSTCSRGWPVATGRCRTPGTGLETRPRWRCSCPRRTGGRPRSTSRWPCASGSWPNSPRRP